MTTVPVFVVTQVPYYTEYTTPQAGIPSMSRFETFNPTSIASGSGSNVTLNEDSSIVNDDDHVPFQPVLRSVKSVAQRKKGYCLLIIHEGQIYMEASFQSKFAKKRIAKSGEVSVYSTYGKNEMIGKISVHCDVSARTINIQGRDFVPVELLRNVQVSGKDIVQGYFKLKCMLRNMIEEKEIVLREQDGMHVVYEVSGFLAESGVRRGMILAEILDYSSNNNPAVRMKDTVSDVNYRLTFKYNLHEQLQKFENDQVYTKLQGASSKAVIIQHWDHYLKKLPFHLGSLVKCTPQIFAFGIVLSAKQTLASDETMYHMLDLIERYGCHLSHYVKGGNLKADPQNKLTILIQLPSHKDIEEQKFIASELMAEINIYLQDSELKSVTAETAESVTLMKMLCRQYTALRLAGTSVQDLERALDGVVFEDMYKQSAAWMGFNKLVCNTVETNFNFNLLQTSDVFEECFHVIRSKVQHLWTCDLVNSQMEAEKDRMELIYLSEFFGRQIEDAISCGNPDTVKFFREFLLGGEAKEDLQRKQDGHQNRGDRRWFEVFKWNFFKTQKKSNLENLRQILRRSRASQSAQI